MSNKEEYKIYCESRPDIPLFSQYWWMDAACKGMTWDVLLYKNASGEIIASMPYLIKSKFGVKYILQPELTQTNGIHIDYPKSQSEQERLSLEKKVCDEFISQIESLKTGYFMQCFHHSFTNWLPFYWKGFRQTTRYTYIIEDISDIDAVFRSFAPAKQRQIRKSLKSNFKVRTDASPEDFYNYHSYTLQQKGERNINSKSIELSVISAAIDRGQGVILNVFDGDDNLHASLFLVWDSNKAYFLLPAVDQNYRTSGASSLIVFEAIKYVKDKCKSFDFEGSMSENIEFSYRQFGTRQTPYFKIEKAYNLLFKMRDAFQIVSKAISGK